RQLSAWPCVQAAEVIHSARDKGPWRALHQVIPFPLEAYVLPCRLDAKRIRGSTKAF
uniref:Uncharacterized protein n=1 Tax=Accipiter nisus TaxID=211598 RepID=A0A8B9MVQ8_9AVES